MRSTYSSSPTGRNGDAASGSGVYVHIGLTGLTTQSGNHKIVQDQSFRFELPGRFDLDHIQIAKNDLRILHDVFQRSPGAVTDLHNAALRGDRDSMRKIAHGLGITEEGIKTQGGGMWVYIAGAAVFIAAALIFGGGERESEPVGQGDNEGGGDAGLPPGGLPE
ncbi:hypothetical protein AB0R12_00285 [Streptomyces niveus]|uniref:hypothetical protein n=1 Tax=Streptomyces niveus TaxID=193462 RepID=UPI00342AC682